MKFKDLKIGDDFHCLGVSHRIIYRKINPFTREDYEDYRYDTVARIESRISHFDSFEGSDLEVEKVNK